MLEDDIYCGAFCNLSWKFVDDDRFVTVLNAKEKVKNPHIYYLMKQQCK